MKRQQDLKEEVIIFTVLESVNIPKFVQSDKLVFNSITMDLFPNIDHDQQDNVLKNSLVKACQETGNIPKEVIYNCIFPYSRIS